MILMYPIRHKLVGGSDMADKDGPTTDTKGDERTRDRSPPFPFISLEKAIERAKQFEAQYKKSAGRISNVLTLWDFGLKSSGGSQTVAALKAFGLVETEGSAGDRKIKLTDLAQRILKDERPGKRDEGIKEAALKPKSLAEHWDIWGTDRPPDAECLSELTLERGYTEDAAVRFLRVYDDTVKYAKLGASDKIIDDEASEQPRKKEVVGSGNLVAGRAKLEAKIPHMDNHLQDVFNVSEGQAVVQWPAAMSRESFEDFEAWLEIIKRKISRQIAAAELNLTKGGESGGEQQ
jgi:hypothetical protein